MTHLRDTMRTTADRFKEHLKTSPETSKILTRAQRIEAQFR